jgi:radical SAM-linked protein
MTEVSKYRLRLTFAKKAQIKYIAHLDLALAWERALRRARLPLAYSQGFNPRPKMQIASSLPLGVTGRAELIDIILTQPIDPAEALTRIKTALPLGIELLTVEEVPLKAPSRQDLLRQAEYHVTVETDLPAAELTQRINALLAADSLAQTRQRQHRVEQIDLRPWLHNLRLAEIDGYDAHLYMRLTAGQHGNLRPTEVLAALGLAKAWADVERTRLIFSEESLPT